MPASINTPRRALIVEDDPLFATVYRENIAACVPGIEIEISRNGYLGLLYLAHNRPDLIILDLHMPGFDGFEFLDIVKRKRDLLDLPILVVSSVKEALTEPLRALPQVFVFAKPLRPSLLQKLVRQLITPSADFPTAPARTKRVATAKLEAYVGDDWSLQREIARQFYDLAPDRIAQLEECVRRRDYLRLRDWCHALTGTSAMIGAETLQQQIATLRQTIATGNHEAIAVTVNAVTEELRQIAILLDHDFDLHDESN